MHWLIGRKAMVRAPGQNSKQNTKCISSAISSQQISGKTAVNVHEGFESLESFISIINIFLNLYI